MRELDRSERQHFEAIRRWVYDHTGIYYPERKNLLLYHRLMKLCHRLGIPDLKELHKHLRRGDLPGLAGELACAVSTNHSYFFREESVLGFFREHIIPALPERSRWRLWSAACASGEEAYTVAIILAETLSMAKAREQAAILGTDIDYMVLRQAEQGVYPDHKLEHVPPDLLRRYFRPVGAQEWKIHADLQGICTFRRLNLMSFPWPFKNRFHVILCRNVLYYFDLEHQRDLVERFYEVTVPGGWLITSVTEPVQSLSAHWKMVTSGVYRKVQ
ncbi:MAG: protein-glutamate O-methyltransferase CheR [Anaerolineae bacterium]|nr:protein-glutamate O-methyltransferase CheR [Anaerolineae bacterium]